MGISCYRRTWATATPNFILIVPGLRPRYVQRDGRLISAARLRCTCGEFLRGRNTWRRDRSLARCFRTPRGSTEFREIGRSSGIDRCDRRMRRRPDEEWRGEFSAWRGIDLSDRVPGFGTLGKGAAPTYSRVTRAICRYVCRYVERFTPGNHRHMSSHHAPFRPPRTVPDHELEKRRSRPHASGGSNLPGRTRCFFSPSLMVACDFELAVKDTYPSRKWMSIDSLGSAKCSPPSTVTHATCSFRSRKNTATRQLSSATPDCIGLNSCRSGLQTHRFKGLWTLF